MLFFLSKSNNYAGLHIHSISSRKPKIEKMLGKVSLMFVKTHAKFFNSSSYSEMFFKMGVLKNFAIFTGKHLC